ncbi:hypothetical protein [uncultured Endozoicomonas sp.]|uniref:hypothetical protein n=1 Tax=uncultured Endozoicomonas sp. TaxID=432652 RepID=UPI00262EB185|nr:hypothetical protein [uncultured Endozoicomonas sp.]
MDNTINKLFKTFLRPDDVFCLIKRSESEVPGIYHVDKKRLFKENISADGVQRFKIFSYTNGIRTPAEAYSLAVKARFDFCGVEYPKTLFSGQGVEAEV